MTCYSPLQAYVGYGKSKNGKRNIVFDRRLAVSDSSLHCQQLPCGQCIGCRLDRSRQWAVRCVHEAQLHKENCFITLTYDSDYLPKNGSLQLRHFQLFMKKLRFQFGSGIRFYHCGEYGETFGRPHYHALLFNFDFPDKQLWKVQNDQRIYVSDILSELWGKGFCTVGSVTFESAAYVARYVLKKSFGAQADLDYVVGVDQDTGELEIGQKEYTTMSRRPGIGKVWYDKYKRDAYPHDFIVMFGGKKVKPPRYYDTQFEIDHNDEFVKLKEKRVRNAKRFSDNNTRERLDVRRQCKEISIKKLVRNLE